ncbi:MAG: BatD family protein [Candidatus Eisenbacteria bacterium]
MTELVYALFPTQAGKLDITGAGLECTVPTRSRRRDPFDVFGMLGGMGEPRRVKLETKTLRVQVDPLPAPAPAEFTGGVGQYRLRAELDRKSAAQNEPLTLTITVTGTGNVSAVGDPKLPEWIGFRAYPPTAETDATADGNGAVGEANDRAAGKKTWKIVLIPETTGHHTLSPIKLAVYDPSERRYESLAGGPFEVDVAPAGSVATNLPQGEVARVGRDLRTIRGDTKLRPIHRGAPWTGAGFWAVNLAPLLLLAGAYAVRKRAEQERADRVGLRSRRAPGRLRRELEALDREVKAGQTGSPAEGFRRFGDALERYFTEKFNFPVRGRTRDDLAERLRATGVDEAGIAETRALLDRCDFALFAPAAVSADDLAAAVAQALAVADRLDDASAKKARPRRGGVAILAVLLAVPVLAWSQGGTSLATPPLDLAGCRDAFLAANQAYQAGDFATAIGGYRAIRAAGYESADLYLNLGNACYRAGKLGWAVEAFERGRRLAPGDPDLRSNLELALADSRDRQAEVGESRLLEGMIALQDRLPLNQALGFTSVAWWLLAAWLAARIAWKPVARAFSWIGGTVIVLLISLAGWTGVLLLGAAQRPNAVVVGEELAVRSNPDAGGTVEFTLHAGTRVRLGRERAGFREVLFSERLRGWADAAGLAALD